MNISFNNNQEYLESNINTNNDVDENEKLFLNLLSELTYDEVNDVWYNEDGDPAITKLLIIKTISFSYINFQIHFNPTGQTLRDFLNKMVKKHLKLNNYTVFLQ